MTFRNPGIPEFAEVITEERATETAFYVDTELGRKYIDASREWERLSREERAKIAGEMHAAADADEREAFYRKETAGIEQTIKLLESLQIGEETYKGEEARKRVMTNKTRRSQIVNAHEKLFNGDGS